MARLIDSSAAKVLPAPTSIRTTPDARRSPWQIGGATINRQGMRDERKSVSSIAATVHEGISAG
jgi:hypothetical protein